MTASIPPLAQPEQYLLPGNNGEVVKTAAGVVDWGPESAGGGAVFAYTHDQMAAATTWSIPHNLNGFPNITVVDSSGAVVEGDVHYIDSNNIQVIFSAPFSGKAYLS